MPSPDVRTEVPPTVRVALLARALRRGPVTLRLGGASMTPCIPHDSRVTLEPLQRPPRRGDVLAVQLWDRVVVHRVVDLVPGGAWIRLQGDAHAGPDPWVPRKDVLARATQVEWRGRIHALHAEDARWWRAAGTLFRWARAARHARPPWRTGGAGGAR